MTGKTHRIIGIATGLTYLIASARPEYSPATLGTILVGSYFGSLIPDLDEPAAAFWNTLPFGHALGEMVDPFFRHRNLSHSLLGLGLFTILLYLLLRTFPQYWGIETTKVLIAAGLAFSSHLLADMITVEGIPLLYPWHRMLGIPPKPFQGIRIMTGKWFENLVIFPAVDIWLAMTIVLNLDKIKKIIFK